MKNTKAESARRLKSLQSLQQQVSQDIALVQLLGPRYASLTSLASHLNLRVSYGSDQLSINTVSVLITGLDQLQRFTAVCRLLLILFCLQMHMSSFLTSALCVLPTACASLCKNQITLNAMLHYNDCCLPEEKGSWSMPNVKASLTVTYPTCCAVHGS